VIDLARAIDRIAPRVAIVRAPSRAVSLIAGAATLLATGACAPARATPMPIPARRTAPSGPRFLAAPELRETIRDTLRAVLQRAVHDSAFPGAIAIVGDAAGATVSAGAGRIDWDATAPPPDEHTLWDLASLTKVVGTTTAVMRLASAGAISLDAPVQRYLPRWTGPGVERVTVRHLLVHSSGLPAHRPLYQAGDARAAHAAVYSTPLDTVPGARTLYSDLGIILLGDIVQSVTGEPLDVHLRRTTFEALGMHETMFNPPAGLLWRIAPTETDPWRGREVHGEVHDENAYSLGGVAPHAGLFSSAHDLARFARMYLGGGALDSVRVLDPEIIELFTTAVDPGFSTRALGWDTADGRNSAGSLMGPRAFGHTGFTGTSIWIDPDPGVFVVLLSNRVNPTRANGRITVVRRQVADAVMSIVLDGDPPPGK
jgi:CubicO group peptidase (beta-lactamase class C family)